MNRPTKLILIARRPAAVAISGANAKFDFRAGTTNPSGQSNLFANGRERKPSGNYEAGTQIVVSADRGTVAGSQFTGWTGDIAILANPFISRTTATIPSTAVSITATYTEPSQAAKTDSTEAPAASEADPAPTTNAAPVADANWQG